MGGNLVRAGGAVLAALAIAAGGALAGSGTAGAIFVGDVWVNGSIDNATGGKPCSWDILPRPCSVESFQSNVLVGDTYLDYWGTDRAQPGDKTTFSAAFYLGDPSTPVSDDVPRPDVVINGLTHHAPRGFEFTGAWAYAYSHRNIQQRLDVNVVVDPVTGDVTVTAPDGGWAIPKDRNKENDNGRVHVALNYTVAELGGDSTSGMTFTGTDTPASGGWVATGDTRSTGWWLRNMGS